MALEDTDRSKHVKKVIGRKSYNTATSTLIFHTHGERTEMLSEGTYYPDEAELYRTGAGAYFLLFRGSLVIRQDRDGNTVDFIDKIEPISDEKAMDWVEKNCNEKFVECFGEVPEGGIHEVSTVLRLPNILREQIKQLAKKRKLTLKALINQILQDEVNRSEVNKNG